jgi:chemotaxis protein methyltransferase CheR
MTRSGAGGVAVAPDILDRFRHYLRETTGIALSRAKTPMIHQRLKRCVMEANLDSTEAFLEAALTNPAAKDALQNAVECLTTNTTSFFREPQHFEFLSQRILPALIAGKQGRRIKAWSAACSEGAEAYTIAMTLAEERRKGVDFDFAGLGTDLSQRMLEKAQKAVFTHEQVAAVPLPLLDRYVLTSRDAAASSQTRICPELRSKVRFRAMNLMAPTYPLDRDIDVVFLRNILIYFDADVQQRVILHVAQHIAPGGYLIVGHSESMIVRQADLQQIVPTLFQKAGRR